MEAILQVLKLDHTIVYQLAIFLFTYIVLLYLVFKPYMNAHVARKNATAGTQELAEQYLLETKDISFKYESKAREINTQIKGIFDDSRKEATKLQEEIIQNARAQAEKITKSMREELKSVKANAKEALKKEVPVLSQTISDRLLGKDVH